MTRLEKFRAMTKNVRTSTTVLLWVFSLAALSLFIASFLVPPMGEIDPSVLKAGAEIFAFAALIEAREAILEGLGVKVTHGSTTIEVKDQDGKDPETDPEPQPEDETENDEEYDA